LRGDNPPEDIQALQSVQAVVKHSIFRACSTNRLFHPPRTSSSG